jgi:addiction module HigA family antidote
MVTRMLRSFGDDDTERVWQQQQVQKLDEGNQKAALRKLLILDAADDIRDLQVPLGDRLEKLRGDRSGFYSIRINLQWRICFNWTAAGPEDVEIVDDHWKAWHMNTTPIMNPIHPGEVLLQEYLEPLGVTQHRLAVAIGVPPRRINEIVHGKRRITADTALRMARYFGTTEQFWLNLQGRYDVEIERDRLTQALDDIQPLHSS